MPLEDIPDLLYKLCSGAPLCWADMMAAYGPGAADASAAKDGSASMLDYLSTHGVTAKLNAAVNELAKVRASPPLPPSLHCPRVPPAAEVRRLHLRQA